MQLSRQPGQSARSIWLRPPNIWLLFNRLDSRPAEITASERLAGVGVPGAVRPCSW